MKQNDGETRTSFGVAKIQVCKHKTVFFAGYFFSSPPKNEVYPSTKIIQNIHFDDHGSWKVLPLFKAYMFSAGCNDGPGLMNLG